MKKPKKDYNKPAVAYNALKREAAPGEELPATNDAETVGDNTEDPSKPQIGATQDKT